MRSLACLFTLGGALGALAAPAHAEQLDAPSIQSGATYTLDVGSHIRWPGDTSAAILVDDVIAGAQVTAGRSLTRTSARGHAVDVGVFARWTRTVASGQLFGSLDTALSQHGVGGGVRVDAPLWWRLRLVGEGEAGMLRSALRVDAGEMTPADDHAWGPYAAAALGGELGVIERPNFRFAFGVDVGYLVTAPVSLRALPADRPDEALSIPTEFQSIGKLDTRGWTYAFSIRGSF